MLQEASIHNGKEDAQCFANVLGKQFAYVQETAQTVRSEPQANALVWNADTVSVETVDVLELPPFHPKARLYKQYMRIFDNKHTVAYAIKWMLQKRMSLMIEGVVNDYTFRIYVIHFDIFGLATKKKQMAYLLADAGKRRMVDIEVIAGDLNTFKFFRFPTWESVIHLAEQQRFVDVTATIPWTYAGRRVPLRHKLDAIFVKQSGEKFSYDSRSIAVKGSDHIPLFATLRQKDWRSR